MDQYLGYILMFGGNFNPRGFQLCNGQILPLSQNTALFSLLGVNYGGNGTSTFALPDLRGRTPIAWDQGNNSGPGLSSYSVGEMTGTESTSLLTVNMAQHNHLVNANTTIGDATSPANAILAEGPKSGSGPSAKSTNFYAASTVPTTSLHPLAISVNSGGAGLPMPVMQPYLVITMLIATTGIFPARN